MKRIYHSIFFIITLFLLNGCQKTAVQPPFENEFTEPYTTGIIKFQYPVQARINKVTAIVDTTVSFTAISPDTSVQFSNGYWQPSIPWLQVFRTYEPDGPDYRGAGIFIQSTDFDTLTLPYTFKKGDYHLAQFEYIRGKIIRTDSLGVVYVEPDLFIAFTTYDNFAVTLLSKKNDRVQGTFSGIATNRAGGSINISQGIFDIEIVRR